MMQGPQELGHKKRLLLSKQASITAGTDSSLAFTGKKWWVS